MLKKIVIMFFIFLNFIYVDNVFADSQENYNDIDDIYYETGLDDIIFRYSDRDTLENIKNIFNKDNITNKNKLLSFSPMKMIRFILSNVKNELKKPLKVMVGILGVVLISAIFESLKVCFSNNSLNEVINCLCILSIFISVGYPLIECIKSSIGAVVNLSDFMISFIPMYTGVMASCGMTLTSGIYHTFLFFICQVFSQIFSKKLLPVIGVYMAFCLVGSLTPSLNISQASKSIKNIVTWILGFIVTIFVGLITVQGVVSCSIDTAGTKTAKFMIGSVVPVIGSVISDAYTSVKGCFNFVRTSIGAMSIVFITLFFLPTIVNLIVWIFTIKLSVAVSDFMGVKRVSELIESSGNAISLLFAIIVSYILLVVISMTIILVLGLGLN